MLFSILKNRVVSTVAVIFACRTLGFFSILPVFSVCAEHYAGATPLLIGIAFGIYGLTQAALQIPLGWLSDRYGRVPIIIVGLLLLIFGSIIAATATSVTGLIVGRAIQGMGAVGSTLIALVADVTDDKQRSSAMAVVGMSIGFSFILAIVLGSSLSTWLGMHSIFWLTAGLAVVAIGLALSISPKQTLRTQGLSLQALPALLTNKGLLRLNISIFAQHAIFSCYFFALPILLATLLVETRQWLFYTGLLLSSFLVVFPLLRRIQYTKVIFLSSIVCVGMTSIILSYYHAHLLLLSLLLFCYLLGFHFLEANIPSLVSQQAPAHYKGMALGIYSSMQYLGIAAGGTLAGWVYGYKDISWIFLVCAMMCFGWFLLMYHMNIPNQSGVRSKPIANELVGD